MTKDEQIKSYMDLLLHTNNLFGWIYDEHMQMLFTTYPGDDYQGFDALFQLQVPPALNGGLPSHPRFIYSFFNLAWLIDFEIVDNQLKKFYVLGPTFTGENSYNELVKAMDQRNLSIKTKANVSKLLTSLPIVASNVMMSYASQLHYLISGTAIDINTIESVQNKGNYENPSIVPSSQQHHGIWASEQEFLRLFKDGNPDYSKALQNSSHLSNGVKHNPKNSLRAAKNNAFVLLTLISRAAIEGGVSPNVAYDLCDFYGQRIEDSVSLDDNGTVIEEMQTVYFQKVCEAKHDNPTSLIYAIIGALVSFCLAFLSTLFFWKEKTATPHPEEDMPKFEKTEVTANPVLMNDFTFTSPVEGKVIPLTEVNDDVFSSKIMGDGIAIVPTVGALYAPADGVIEHVFESGHAASMMTTHGVEVIFHIGIDTIQMNGQGFHPKITDGQHVKAGELLIEFDIDEITKAGYDPVVIMVITNSDRFMMKPSNDHTNTLQQFNIFSLKEV